MRRHLLAAAFLIVSTALASAHGYKLGTLVIEHPWTRATPPGAVVGGGYVVINNQGAAADRLVAVTTSASDRAELHEMAVKDGVMTMRPMPDGVVIPAGGKVEFKPGGMHVMFEGLKAPLQKGEKVKARLEFEKAGSIEVEFEVGAIGQTAPEHHHTN